MSDITTLLHQLVNAYTAIEHANQDDEDEMDMVLTNFSLIAFELAEAYKEMKAASHAS